MPDGTLIVADKNSHTVKFIGTDGTLLAGYRDRVAGDGTGPLHNAGRCGTARRDAVDFGFRQ